jgi:hypothetical protein
VVADSEPSWQQVVVVAAFASGLLVLGEYWRIYKNKNNYFNIQLFQYISEKKGDIIDGVFERVSIRWGVWDKRTGHLKQRKIKTIQAEKLNNEELILPTARLSARKQTT